MKTEISASGYVEAHAHPFDSLPESDFCGLCEKWEVLSRGAIMSVKPWGRKTLSASYALWLMEKVIIHTYLFQFLFWSFNFIFWYLTLPNEQLLEWSVCI